MSAKGRKTYEGEIEKLAKYSLNLYNELKACNAALEVSVRDFRSLMTPTLYESIKRLLRFRKAYRNRRGEGS